MAKSVFDVHKAAIKSGTVTKTNIDGLRKALNAFERTARGYSVGATAYRMTESEREWLLDKLPYLAPRVDGAWHESGKAMLQSKRYAKQLANVADIIADLDHFELRGFDAIGPLGLYWTPVYRAFDTQGRSFPFCVIPWQAGGNGPQIMSANYW